MDQQCGSIEYLLGLLPSIFACTIMEQHLRLVSIPSLPGNALTPAPYPEKRKLVGIIAQIIMLNQLRARDTILNVNVP